MTNYGWLGIRYNGGTVADPLPVDAQVDPLTVGYARIAIVVGTGFVRGAVSPGPDIPGLPGTSIRRTTTGSCAPSLDPDFPVLPVSPGSPGFLPFPPDKPPSPRPRAGLACFPGQILRAPARLARVWRENKRVITDSFISCFYILHKI